MRKRRRRRIREGGGNVCLNNRRRHIFLKKLFFSSKFCRVEGIEEDSFLPLTMSRSIGKRFLLKVPKRFTNCWQATENILRTTVTIVG